MSRPWWTMQTPPVPEQAIIDPRPSAAAHHSGGGSIGTLVVVLAVITILGVLAGVIARICGGRHLAGNGDYDFEGWVEHKCSTCIDGSLGSAQPPSKPSPDDAKPPPAAEESKPAESKDNKDEEKGGGDGDGDKPADDKTE